MFGGFTCLGTLSELFYLVVNTTSQGTERAIRYTRYYISSTSAFLMDNFQWKFSEPMFYLEPDK